jgi:predicted nucleic acid-binding Zn ribbon protein
VNNFEENLMICPHCGKEHPDEAVFCPSTGKSLAPSSACPHCGESHPSSMQFCPRTGKVITSQPISTRSKRKPMVWIAILLLVVLVTGAGGVWAIGSGLIEIPFLPLTGNPTLTPTEELVEPSPTIEPSKTPLPILSPTIDQNSISTLVASTVEAQLTQSALSYTPTLQVHSLKVLWDMAHFNTPPQSDELGGLYDYIDKFIQEQSILEPSAFDKELKRIKGTLIGTTAQELVFDVPSGIEFLKIRISPIYYESEDVLIEPKLFDPINMVVDYQVQLNWILENSNYVGYYLIKQPSAGQWKMTITGKVNNKDEPFSGTIDYEVVIGHSLPTINSITLSNTNLLIISDPGTFYFPEELQSIRSFVMNGGSLLLVEVPYIMGLHGDQIDSIAQTFSFRAPGENNPYALSDLGWPEHMTFGVNEFSTNLDWPRSALIEFYPLNTHPLTQGVSKVLTFRPSGFYSANTTEVQQILQGGPDVAIKGLPPGAFASPIVATTFGNGKVVAVGDPALIGFWNETKKYQDLEVDYGQYDNAILAKNIVDWLTEK